jgi:mannose-6-phosphate isomerase-like protein (cupin superfamily)
MKFESKQLPVKPDELAPDGSEIRLLSKLKGGGLCYCTLPTKQTSHAVRHRTVEEIWYFVVGRGEVWRKFGVREETVVVTPGVSLTIPVGTCFQFRNVGREPLSFLIVTMPPWPGKDEAVTVANHWSPGK